MKAAFEKISGDRQAERLTKLYAQAEREIAARLQKAIARRGAGSYTAAQLKRQQSEIRGIIEELRKVSPEYIDKFVKAAYGGGVKVAEAELTAAGISILAKMGGINNKVMAVYSSQISSRLSEVLTTAGNKTADIYAILRKDDALTGVLSGYESITEAQKKMLDNAAEGDVVGFVDKAGRQWSMERYTEMLTRTATMEMHNDAKRTEFLAHGEDLVIVSSHGGSCEMCAPYNGAILSLTGATEGYETLDEAEAQGLFHPNCKHTYSLYISDNPEEGLIEPETGEETETEEKPIRDHLEPNTLTAEIIQEDFAKAGKTVTLEYARQVRQDIYDYTAATKDVYKEMRAAQRNNDVSSQYYGKMERVEDYLQIAPLYPQEKTLYRGISGKGAYDFFDSLPLDYVYHDGAIASSSSKYSVGIRFSQKDEEHPVLLIIKGGLSKATSIRGVSAYCDEYEVLMSKTTGLKVKQKLLRQLDKKDKAKTLVLVVEYTQ